MTWNVNIYFMFPLKNIARKGFTYSQWIHHAYAVSWNTKTCKNPWKLQGFYAITPIIHYNDVIMGAIASEITSLTNVYSIVIQTQIKENIKAPRHWPSCGEFTGHRWIPRTNGQLRGKCFHLMTSSRSRFLDIRSVVRHPISDRPRLNGIDIYNNNVTFALT